MKQWDYVIIGGGHNGLICANYLAKAKHNVLILESRSEVGGAAATEEIFPGYHFSRFSYVFSIFRAKIIQELFPKSWQKELILYRNEPALFVPSLKPRQYLLLSNDPEKTQQSIASFSGPADAEAYQAFYAFLQEAAAIIDPLLDHPPTNGILDAIKLLPSVKRPKNHPLNEIIYLLTSSSATILNQWFEHDALKAALSFSGTVGQLQSPYSAGSAFLQLHHVSNTIEINGQKSRYYPKGGMGAVALYLKKLAVEQGVTVQTNQTVKKILVQDNLAQGVALSDGTLINAKHVVSNCTYERTFNQLLDHTVTTSTPKTFQRGLKGINYKTNCCKINLVLKGIPTFTCIEEHFSENMGFEERKSVAARFMHNTLITGNHMQCLHENYLLAEQGRLPDRPTIQMLMPSLLDESLTPEGSKDVIALLFVQYTPYDIKGGWSEEQRQLFIDQTFDHLSEYAPNFKSLIKHIDAVFPPDIEQLLGLTGGNIFQGGMDLDNLFTSRPMPSYNQYKTPIQKLYSCSSANHPGGGVCGAAGRNAAKAILKDK